MELQLESYLQRYSAEALQYSDSNVNFARHQILDITKELLEQSYQGRLTKDALIGFTENIDHTLKEVGVACTVIQ